MSGEKEEITWKSMEHNTNSKSTTWKTRPTPIQCKGHTTWKTHYRQCQLISCSYMHVHALLEFSKLLSYIHRFILSFSPPFGVLTRNTYSTHRKFRRMVSLLEIFLSAILGDLATRSIDFFISRRPKPPAPEDRLQSVLLRAQVIVDEAEKSILVLTIGRGFCKRTEYTVVELHQGVF